MVGDEGAAHTDAVPEAREMVRHPAHYNFAKHEVIDVLHDWQLPYPLSDVIKYLTRAGKKDPNTEIQDLEKARFYLDYRIKQLTTENGE